jgi:hypothetical protein
MGTSDTSTDPWKLSNGRSADYTTLAHPMDSAGSVDTGIGDTGLQAEMSQQEQQRAAINEPQGNATADTKGGTGSSILGTLGSIFMPGLSAIAGLFDGGSKPAAVAEPYVMPPSVNFSGSLNAGQPGAAIGPDVDHSVTTDFDSGLSSMTPAIASTPSPTLASTSLSPAVSTASQPTSSSPTIASQASQPGGPSVTVSVSAMDASDIAARGSDIADAIKSQLLNSHSLADTINDLTNS